MVSALRATAWQLIYAEMILLTYICTALFWAFPFLPRKLNKSNWDRAWTCWAGICNVRLLVKTMPFLGCYVDMEVDPLFVGTLHETSLMYRLFRHHL
jgi:hypothetical protein